MAITYADAEELWIQAGGPAAIAPVAAAIAMAESSLNPTAVGPSYGGDAGSIGLWQIQSGQHPQWTVAQLKNPTINAQAAVAIYEGAGNSFSPWSTYTEGTYRRFLQSGVPPTPASSSSTPSSASSSSSSSSSSASSGTDYGIGSFGTTLAGAIGSAETSATQTALAGVLVLAGVAVLALAVWVMLPDATRAAVKAIPGQAVRLAVLK